MALYLLFVSYVQSGLSSLILHSIENNNKIEQVFLEARTYIDNYKSKNKAYPSVQEFNNWASSLPNKSSGYSIIELSYSLGNYPEEVISIFGEPSTNQHYLLSFWRGEWFEYHASWNEKGALPKDISDYYHFGTEAKDVSVFLFLSFVLVIMAWFIFPKSSKKTK